LKLSSKIILTINIIFILLLYGCGGSEESTHEGGNDDLLNVNDEKVDGDLLLEKTEDDDQYLFGEILPGKGFEEALLAVDGIELTHAMELTNSLRFNVDFRYLVAGEKFKFKLSEDGTRIDKFVYMPNIITFHTLFRNGKTDKLDYKKTVLETETRYRIIRGEIESSLNQTLIERDDVTPGIRVTTNGVLECIVSFRTDARNGDRYKILVAEKFYKGEKVPGAKILYASYEGKRAGFNEAFFYEDIDPKSAFNAHYSESGKALIPSAMRLPVDRVHVTSPFGYRRHPVTGRRSLHKGVDYGGVIGAPVYAVAKGTVITSGYDKYSGKKVVIRHTDGTKTFYLHLSSILAKNGSVVKARQQIGKIGKTGRVTGPHLHFGIMTSRGKWANPLMRRMIATPKLSGAKYERFKGQMTKTKKLLQNVETEFEMELAKKARNSFVGPPEPEKKEAVES